MTNWKPLRREIGREIGHEIGGDEAWTVRRAVASDVEDLLVVENAAQQAPWSQAVFEKEFTVEWSDIWVVVPPPNSSIPDVSAFLVFWVVHDEVHVLNVAVHPRAQRRGLGRELLTQLVELAAARKMAIVTLEVRKGNDPARGLYRSLGFHVIGERPRYYADNEEDAIVMARILEEDAVGVTSPDGGEFDG